MSEGTGGSLGKLRDLYVSRQMHVTSRIYDETKPVVIAFASGGKPRELTGAAMFEKYRINAVFFSCAEMDWFQYPDLAKAEQVILDFVRPFPQRIAYGFSMGGYGALLSSAAIGADVVMACSPQAAMGPNLPRG